MTCLSRLAPLAALLAALPLAVHAQTEGESAVPAYLDDRSTPEQVVTSMYNAINRQEYLRAHSYYDPGTAPEWPAFREGYQDTASVRLRTGEIITEGAAGTTHSAVPVAIEATSADGTTEVFAGCYRLTQVQPAAQETPPFRGIQIDSGTLEPAEGGFDDAMGSCDL